MSDLNRLRELAALLQPPRVVEAKIKTRSDLEKKFKTAEDGIAAAIDDLLYEIGDGGSLETMLRDVGVTNQAGDVLKHVQTAVSTLKKDINTALMEVEGLLFSAMTESREPEPVSEMAHISGFSSGWLKKAAAKELVAAFRAGEETVELSNGSSFKAVKRITGAQLSKGMVVLASYNQYNQGAELYEVLGLTNGKSDTAAYDSVAEAMKAQGVKTLRDLNEDVRVLVRDLEDGESGPFFYLFNGAWVRGSGAERLSFVLVEKIAGKTDEGLTEAKNHMGESTYQSIASWKRALKAKGDASLWFEADDDTVHAFVGAKPFKKGDTREVGYWDGEVGTVY